MPRDSWTRRLDDRVLGPTGVVLVLGLATLLFGIAAVLSSLDGDAWVQAVFYAVLAVASFQATRVQSRRRYSPGESSGSTPT